jgi:hypothetical protein
MARRILDLFRRGSGGRIADLKPGPLTPGQRKAIPGKFRRPRKDKPTDADLRATMAAQIGVLPAILEPLRPRNSATYEFSLAAAKAYASEIGVNVFHLIDAGVKIEGLSRYELAEFVAENAEFIRTKEAEESASENKKTEPSKGQETNRSSNQEQEIESLFGEFNTPEKDNGSAFF